MMLELVLGALALAFLRARGYRISDTLPSPSWRGLQEGLLLYAAAAAACFVVGWLVPSRSDLVQPIAQMLTNAKPSLVVVLLVSMLNGLYEETFLLGYLTRRFATLGASLAVGLSVLVRLLYHLYQGPSGAVSVVVFGIVLGAVYWRTRRLWPAVVAHSVADLVGLAFWTGAQGA
ncbi:CPBP family intramembrane glutamic endopeptidase [Massilia sp. Se16.2.3]|nr:CPBP family intramembrane glutamic endopeptidase [Massilia sp. Se16.2.3]QNA98673.1 CPBP family intramembrane metalloprotease [Massilia sp. Se16.2.3]